MGNKSSRHGTPKPNIRGRENLQYNDNKSPQGRKSPDKFIGGKNRSQTPDLLTQRPIINSSRNNIHSSERLGELKRAFSEEGENKKGIYKKPLENSAQRKSNLAEIYQERAELARSVGFVSEALEGVLILQVKKIDFLK